MSIFDRLISTLSGGEESPALATAAAEENGERPRRFMGRDGVEAEPAPVVEKGFDSGAVVWLHVQPATMRLLLVQGLGESMGEELTGRQMQDLQRKGLCEAVAYHAGYDQYWKMPSQEAILRTPSLYSIETQPLHKVELQTQLVRQGEPRGFWMRVRIRPEEEVQSAQEQVDPVL